MKRNDSGYSEPEEAVGRGGVPAEGRGTPGDGGRGGVPAEGRGTPGDGDRGGVPAEGPGTPGGIGRGGYTRRSRSADDSLRKKTFRPPPPPRPRSTLTQRSVPLHSRPPPLPPRGT